MLTTVSTNFKLYFGIKQDEYEVLADIFAPCLTSSFLVAQLEHRTDFFMTKTLDTLSVGQSGTVVAVHGLNTSLRRRLLDMGLTPNTKVEVMRFAPLGDPMELNVRGYALTIRKDDAKLIEIA